MTEIYIKSIELKKEKPLSDHQGGVFINSYFSEM